MAGPPRKVPLLCDENIEDELSTSLRENRKFKVTQLPKGTPDHHVWQHAWRKQLVLVTADERGRRCDQHCRRIFRSVSCP
jgi:hypothetical protein